MADSIALIDYGAGNLHSVHNALKAAGASGICVTDSLDKVASADRIVLPGVGAFGSCMAALAGIDGMVETMERRVRSDGVPFLGICVGMQLLADRGVEQGESAGLGWIAGTVRGVEAAPDVKVPHMGWNEVRVEPGAPLLEDGEAYFLHGYHFDVDADADIAARTDHGASLVAAIARDNMMGVQFHPEKSQAYGLAFLARFLDWRPR